MLTDMSTEDLASAPARRASDLVTSETAEEIAFFEDSSHVAPIGNVVAGLVALSLLWSHVPTVALLAWFAVVLVLAALQAIAALHPESAAQELHTPGRLIDTNALAGVVWGVLPWLDIGGFSSDEVYRWICLALAFAIGAGAMGGLSVLTGIALRIHTPMFLLIAGAFLVAGSPAVSIGVVVYLTLMATDLRATGQHLRQLVAARVETADIAAEAESEARHDPLTGLLNRAGALDRIEGLRGCEPFATMFVDLDYFKDVNDRLGHEAGDHALVETSRRIEHAMRPEDVVARLGGDEFLVVLPNDEADIERLCTRMIAAIERPIAFGADEVRISASIGFTVVRDEGWTTSELLREADHALYEAKRAGREQVVRFDDRLAGELAQRIALEGELRAAIATNGIETLAQPVVDLATNEIVAVEVTPHWTSNAGVELGAARIRDLAEEIGLGDALTRALLDRAAAARVAWRDDASLAGAIASVRISAPHLVRGDVMTELRSIVTSRGVRPGELQLLLTETAGIRDPRLTTEVVEAAQAMGVSIALGEFGGGKSTLADLLQLPIEVVGLHPNLAAFAAADDRVATLVGGLDHVARQLGLTVAADGVDTPEQLATVRRLGIPLAQGEAVGPRRPLP